MALRRLGLQDAGFVDEGSKDIDHAEYVLAKLLDGDEVEIGPFDNYEVMLQHITDWMKTEDYDLEDPFIKENIKEYAFELQARMQMKMIGAMMQQAKLDEASAIMAAPTAQMEGELAIASGGGPQNQGAGAQAGSRQGAGNVRNAQGGERGGSQAQPPRPGR